MLRFRWGVLLCLAGVGLTGCGGSGTFGEESPHVRVFNGVDAKATISASYADSSGNLLGTSKPAPFGSVAPADVIIPDTNATPLVSSGGSVLFSGPSQLYRINSRYSLYTGGTVGEYVAIPLNDIDGQGNTVGSAELRAVHVGVNTTAVDLFVVPANPGGVSGASLFSSLRYGHATDATNASVAVDGNGYAAMATTDGTEYEVIATAHNSVAPIATITTTLTPQVFYTIVVYDAGGVAGLKVLSDRH